MPPALDLSLPVGRLAAALVDIPSVSGGEGPLADAVQAALAAVPGLAVDRDGDAVVARAAGGRGTRVLLAGHLDTVPIAGNLPSAVRDGRLHGCGSSDMKSGLAVLLRLAATVTSSPYDLSYICYDQEEVEASRNGLGRLAAAHRDWLAADLAVLLEPTGGAVEAGCQGTLRAVVRTAGRRAHTARAWRGVNAIHAAAGVLARLADYRPREVTLDGCTYREGLQAVAVSGGLAGNVVPDACEVTVNHRFAPDRSVQQAADYVREVFAGFDVEVVDAAPAAPPGLAAPAVARFVAAVGGRPVAKYGWTDVARFAALGVPALNYGPGDPELAHTVEESVDLAVIEHCEQALRRFLSTA